MSTNTTPPATDALVMSLERTLAERAEHDHPAKGGDLFCLNLTSFMGERMGPVLARLRAAEAEIERLATARFKRVERGAGSALFVHGCGNAEWWDEFSLGPIDEQGCDACESAPDGTWRPAYVQTGAGR